MNMLRRRGFTLVEMLAVMAMIALLVGLVLYAARGALQKADIAATQTMLQKHMAALDEWRVQKGAYWPAAGILDINTDSAYQDPTAGVAQYLSADDRKFVDTWGSGIRYVRISKYSAYVYSIGPDGVDQTNPPVVPSDDIRIDRSSN